MLVMKVQNGLLTPEDYLADLSKAISADFARFKQGDKVAGTHVVIMKKELKEAQEGGLA